MLKNLIILLTSTIHFTSQCSPGEDYIPATLEEEINYAGIILIGNITKVTGGINDKNKVSLENVVYYKGCGKTKIIVENFYNGRLCGPGIPKLGDKIIVFAYDDGFGANLRINDFMIHTGYVNWSFGNEGKVRDVTGVIMPGSCRCARRSEICLDREGR